MAYLGRKGASAALTSADIPDNSITAAKIVEGTITVGDIGTDAVGADELADDAVDTNAIADDAITGGKLANDIAIDTSGAITTTGALATATLVTTGNVGIGTAPHASSKLTVRGNGTNFLDSDSTGGPVNTISRDGDGLWLGQVEFANTGTSQIVTRTASNLALGTGNSHKMVIGTSGDVTVSTGNLVIGTSGKGIDFSATADGGVSTPSELLDDYEEGTWTPTMPNNTGGGTLTATGHYVRIGKLLYISFYWYRAATCTGSGVVSISNLPFTVTGGAGSSYPIINIGYAGKNGANLNNVNNNTNYAHARWQSNNTTDLYPYGENNSNWGGSMEFGGSGILLI
jgi:hypothetical protein